MTASPTRKRPTRESYIFDFWSEDEVFLALWLTDAEGKTRSQVAKELHAVGFPKRTRNAVCGLLHRVKRAEKAASAGAYAEKWMVA